MSNWKDINIRDSWSDRIGSTMIDQLMAATPIRLCGGVFNGSVPDSNFYEYSITANATGSITGNTLALTTTTGSGSSIFAGTRSLARYMGASINSFRTVDRFGDTGTANNVRQFGVYNGLTYTDGFFFRLSNTTFSIVSRTASSDTVVNSGSFNGTVASWTVDTNFHTFEILYTNKVIEFYIDDVRIHSITETNVGICNTRHFKAFGSNVNTGVGSICNLYCQVISISRHGTATSQAKTYLQEGTTAGVQLKVGPGAIHLMCLSGVSANSVVTLYDGTSASDRKIWTSGVMLQKSDPFFLSLDSTGGTPFDFGLFLVVSGAASNAFIKYE